MAEHQALILSINSIAARVGALEAAKAMEQVERSAQEAAGEVDNLEDRFDALREGAGRLTQIGGILTASVTVPLTAIAGVGIRSAQQLETFAAALRVTIGDAERANAVFDELYEFSAGSPFDWRSLSDGTRLLSAFGTEAEEIVPTLKRIGDIASGTGQNIAELAEIYGKAQVQGRLTMEDINQLTGRGVPLIQEFAAQFGVAQEEIRDLASTGAINFANLEAAFVSLTSEGGKFFGLTEAMAETSAGRFARLKDSIEQVTDIIGTNLLPFFDAVVMALQDATEWFVALDEGTQDLIVSLGAAVAILPVLTTAVGALATAFLSLSVAGAPVWAAFAVGGAAIVGLALLTDHFIGATREAQALAEATRDAKRATDDLIAGSSKRDLENHLAALQIRMRDLLYDFSSGGPVLKEAFDEVEYERLTGLIEQVTTALAEAGTVTTTVTTSVTDLSTAFADEVDVLVALHELEIARLADTIDAVKLEQQLTDAMKDGNLTREQRVRVQQQLNALAGIGAAMSPGLSDAFGLGSPVFAAPTGGAIRQTATDWRGGWDAEVAKEAQAELLAATEESVRAIHDLAYALGGLGSAADETTRAFSLALGAVEGLAAGLPQLADGFDLIKTAAAMEELGLDSGNIGALGAASMLSGIAAVGGGILGVVESILSTRDRLRQAREEIRRDLDDWADSLVPKSAIQKAIDEQTGIYEDQVKNINATFKEMFPGGRGTLSGWVGDLFDPSQIDRETLEIMVGWGGRIGQGAEAALEALDLWEKATSEARDQMAADMSEDIAIRTLVAQGRDKEAEAMRRQIEREKERAEVEALLNDALLDNLDALYAAEDAALAAAEAIEEANRQFNILVTGMEIDARRAALDGRDREAFILRAEAAGQREIAMWEEAYRKDEITIDQLLALKDIINDELTAAVQGFDNAVADLRANLEDDLTYRELLQSGDDRGAAIYQAGTRRQAEIDEAIAAGMDDAFIGRINAWWDREVSNIHQKYDALAAEDLIRSVNRGDPLRESEDAVVRNARSITSMQASTMVDILWSINAGVQETASNTRGGGGSWGPGAGGAGASRASGGGGPVYNISIPVQGPFVGTREDARRFAGMIAEEIDEIQGGRTGDATQAAGTVVLV